MKAGKEKKAIICESWVEPTRQVVPDSAERCAVWEYLFEYLFTAADGETPAQEPPKGAGAAAIAFLLPQAKRMAEAYREKTEKLAANLERANAAKKRNANAEQTQCNSNANAEQTQCNNNISNNNISNNNISNNIINDPQTPCEGEPDEEAEILKIGISIIAGGLRIESAEEFRRTYSQAKDMEKAGTLQKGVRNYCAGCIKLHIPKETNAKQLADFIAATKVQNLRVLECYAFSVENNKFILLCSRRASEAIENEANEESTMSFVRNLGAESIEYRFNV